MLTSDFEKINHNKEIISLFYLSKITLMLIVEQYAEATVSRHNNFTTLVFQTENIQKK